MPASAADRMRTRVRALLDRPGRSQRKLAERLGIDNGEVSRKLTPKQGLQRDFTLRQLDVVAEYLGVPPALLIQADTSALQELTPDELNWVKHFREFPPEVQEHSLRLLDYFAGILPEEKDQRRAWAKYRRLSAKDRAYIERTIDDVWRAQRSERARASDVVAPGSSAESAPSSQTPRASKRRREA